MSAQKETPGTVAAAGANQSSAAIVADRKLFANFAARAAMKGQTLVAVSDGYLIAQAAYSKHCPDLATVDALLRRMGA